MPKAQDFLNSYTVKIASYLAWVNIPDISNAATKDERDAKIDNFKLEVGQKLFRRSASAVATGIGVYGIFDTKDEEKALESWQDNVELGLGLVAAGLLVVKQDMEFQCDRAKACDFKAHTSNSLEAVGSDAIHIEEQAADLGVDPDIAVDDRQSLLKDDSLAGSINNLSLTK